MELWYYLLTPLAVLAVFSLFRFVGCQLVFPLEGVTVEADFPTAILNTKDGNGDPLLVSYWRLQQLAETEPALDETGLNPGSYQRPTQNLPQIASELSPAGSPDVAARLVLGQPGLLVTPPNPANTAMEVFGGFVEIPFSASLNLESFTIEAIVVPTWENVISSARPGRLRAVFEFGGPLPKTSGVALYGGPSDPAQPETGLYKWQVWMGNGTTFTLAAMGTDILFNQPNFLALTYDAPTRELRLFVYHTGVDGDRIKTTKIDQDYAIHGVTVPARIGAGRSVFSDNTRPLYFFQGRIQEVVFFRAALSESQISTHVLSLHMDL